MCKFSCRLCCGGTLRAGGMGPPVERGWRSHGGAGAAEGSLPGWTVPGCTGGMRAVSHASLLGRREHYVQSFAEVALAVPTRFEHPALFRAKKCGFGQELDCARSTYPHAFQRKGVLLYFQELLRQL